MRDRAQLADDAGVVEGAVQAAELADRELDETLRVVRVAHVAGKMDGPAVAAIDPRGDARELRRPARPEHEVRAFLREQRGRGCADATAGAGDDDRLALELHNPSP